MKVVVRATLQSRVHSSANRQRARELAWRWVGAKWPRLLPAESEMARDSLTRSVPGQELLTSTNAQGSVWSLSVAHEERHGNRTWMTHVQVADTGHSDVVSLQTACTDLPDAPLVVAPPRLLGDWVEALELEDAGLAVQGTARDVTDAWQLDALCQHLLSDDRQLPVIALVNRPQSHYYGVDPDGLAENLRGMAHVACVASHLSQNVAERLGHDFAVVHGAARIYAPGFYPQAAASAHPLVRDVTVPAANQPSDAGAFRRLLRRKICALSVSANAPLVTDMNSRAIRA
jgi:hypothetical protein